MTERKNKAGKRLLAQLLAVCMMLTILPTAAFAEDNIPEQPPKDSGIVENVDETTSGATSQATSKAASEPADGETSEPSGSQDETESFTIMRFNPLDEETILVPFGTEEASIPLPQTLSCEAEGCDDAVEINAKWTCESYEGSVAGDYLFVAQSDIHQSAEGVQWPAITVSVMPEPVCICQTPCDSEHINENCPVCSAAAADLTSCMGRSEQNVYAVMRQADAPETAWDGILPESDGGYAFSGGSGTAEDPYLISTAADFVQFAVNVNDISGKYLYIGKNLKLTADIDLAGYTWTPIGITYSYCFNGTLDGDGHTISGLNVVTAVKYDNTNNDEKFAGLFAYIDRDGTIKNLTVSGSVNVSNAEEDVTLSAGLLIGTNNGGMIDGCASIGTVNATATDAAGPVFAGGLIGDSRKSETNPTNLLHSASSADVTVHANNGKTEHKEKAIGSMAGGLVGSLSGNIKNCFATGNVSGTKLGKDGAVGGGAGGLVGAAMDYSDITDSYATGSVTVAETNSGAGGLVGAFIEFAYCNYTVERCYATGAVDASGTTADAGGIVGFNETVNIKHCVALNSSVKGGGDIGRISCLNTKYYCAANYARADMPIGIPGFVAGSEESPMVLSDERDEGSNGASVSEAAWGTWLSGGSVWDKTDATSLAVGASLPKLTGTPATIPQNPTLPAAGSVDEPVQLAEDTVVVKYGRYTISSLDELKRLTGVCCSATLREDIVLTDDWTPVNTGSLVLFDGGGHSITGLNVTSTTASGNYNYAGLFGNASKTAIRDLRVAGSVNVSSENELYVGGMAGLAKRLERCVSEIDVTATGSSKMHAGSLAGSGMAKNCYATGDVYTKYTGSNSQDFMTGGLVGDTKGVQYCYATGEVMAEAANNSKAYTGGIAGQVKAYLASDEAQTYLRNSVALCPAVSGNSATKRMGYCQTITSSHDAWFSGLKARKNMLVNNKQTYGTIMDAQGLDVSVKSANDSGALIPDVYSGWDSSVWAVPAGNLDVGEALPTLKSITATQTPTLKAMPAPRIIVGAQKTALVYGTAGSADYDVNPMYFDTTPLYTVNWVSGTAPTGVTVIGNVGSSFVLRTTAQTPKGEYSFTLSSGSATSAVATLTVGQGTYSPAAKTVYIRAASAAGTVTAAALGFTMDGAKIKAIKTVPSHIVLSADAALSEGTLSYTAADTFKNGKSENYVLTVESADYADFDVTLIFKMAVEDRKLNFMNGADGWGLYANGSSEKYEGEGSTWSVVENGYTDGDSQYPLLKLNDFAFATSAEKALSIDAACAVELTGVNTVTSTYNGTQGSRGVSIGTAVENVFFIGTGALNILGGTSTSNSRGIDTWCDSLSFYGCTINAVGGSAPKSYGIYSNNNINIGGDAYVTGRATATTEGTDDNAYGIYEYYGILNVSDGTLIGEAMAGTNKFGIAFSSLAQQSEPLHFWGDTGSGYNVAGRASTSKSGGVYLIVDSSNAAFAKAKISSYTRNTALEITADTETTDMLATEGWKWNKDTKTLTIDGLGLIVDGSSDSEEISAIKLPTDATIEVSGTNTITVSNSGANGAAGIYGAGALTVKGTGTLTVTAAGCALFAFGDITLQEATLVLSGEGKDSEGMMTAGNITINSGSVKADGDICGIHATVNARGEGGSIAINGGEVTASGGMYAIASEVLRGEDFVSIITIADGSTIKTSESADGSGAMETKDPDYTQAKHVSVNFIPKVTFDYKNGSPVNTVTASKSMGIYTVAPSYNTPKWGYYTFAGWYNSADKTLWAAAKDISAKTVTKSLTVYAKWTMDGFAVHTDPLILEDMESGSGEGWAWDKDTKTLTINDLNMNVAGSSNNEISAITLPAGAALVVSGTNTITVSNSGTGAANGIICGGALDVKGTGTLNVAATGGEMDTALYAAGDITIQDATLVLDGESEGVLAIGHITIESGSVKADGGACGIQSMTTEGTGSGSIAINGGEVTASGEQFAIAVGPFGGNGSITVNGATVKTSENADGSGAMETANPNYSTAKYVSLSFGPSLTVAGDTSFAYSAAGSLQEFTVTAVNWDSAPEFVTVSLKDGNTVEWSDDWVPLNYGTTTIAVNIGNLPAKASGCYTVEVSAENGYNTVIGRTTFTITRADHMAVALSAYALFNKAADNITYTLPALPTGAASYQTPEIKTGDNADGLLKSEPLSVNGRTLSYSVNAVEKDKTAKITVAVPQSTNYNAYSVLITVTTIGYGQQWADTVFGKTGGSSNATYVNNGTDNEPEHKITLNRDVTLNDTVELDENTILDLNGHHVTGAAGKGTIQVSGSGTSLSITDTGAGIKGTITGGTGASGISVSNGASLNVGDGVTVNGGSSANSTGGSGIVALGSGTVTLDDAAVNGGAGNVGGSGIETEGGAVTVSGTVTGGSGTSGAGGSGITATTGTVTVNTAESTVTGGNGGNSGAGGNGINTSGTVIVSGTVSGGSGGSNAEGGTAVSGGAGNVVINGEAYGGTGGAGNVGGNGGNGVTTTTGDISVNGSITGGSGASGTTSNGNGGNGAVSSESGKISVSQSSTITGGNGGTNNVDGGSIVGGSGGTGVATAGSITINGTVTGGNGGNGGTNGGAAATNKSGGGSGGTGADTSAAILGTGTIIGGNGGGIPTGGSGEVGAGGPAAAIGAIFTGGKLINGTNGIKIHVDITEPTGTETITVPADKIADAAVTAQEREQADTDGKVITVSLSITPSDSSAGQKAIEKVLQDKNAAVICIEVKLEKIITPTTGNEEKTAITNANALIPFEIALSPAYQNRTHYAILREHSGAVDMLTAVPNSDGEYISVNADKTVVTVFAKKFSTYALVCSEAVISPISPVPSPSGSGSNHGSTTPAAPAVSSTPAGNTADLKPGAQNQNIEPVKTDSTGSAQVQSNAEREDPATNEGETPAAATEKNAPHSTFYIWLILLAAAAFIVIIIVRRRNKE